MAVVKDTGKVGKTDESGQPQKARMRRNDANLQSVRVCTRAQRLTARNVRGGLSAVCGGVVAVVAAVVVVVVVVEQGETCSGHVLAVPES